ncbi:MAG: TAT-variant-translocated molybdopterin oxidoreductase, partial [Verrucomicrobiota bacterium]
MKRIWQHPQAPSHGKRYWRSLGELNDTPEFRQWLEREFPAGAAELDQGDDVTRRNFLKLMGASTALAGFGFAGCRRPESYLVPFSQNVEWMVPGKPVMFASAMPRTDGCSPVVVTTYDGRPTKTDGNPLHPINRIGDEESSGGSDGFVQSSILDLYDPDRSRFFLHDGEKVSSDEAEAGLTSLMAGADGGKGWAFLVGEGDSPTRNRMLSDLKVKYPSARFFRYEAFGLGHVRTANAAYFGRTGVRQLPRLENATRILCLDCDFLGVGGVGGNSVIGFSRNRRVETLETSGDGDDIAYSWKPRSENEINRLYVVEADFSVTGGMADHRHRLAASQMVEAAKAIAAELGVDAGEPDISGLNEAWIKAAAADLGANRGSSVVLVGRQQPPEIHQIAAAINQAL